MMNDEKRKQIPQHWFYDVETGEYINTQTGIVTNRKCYPTSSGVVNEYAIEPAKMLCGALAVNQGKIQICVEVFTHITSVDEKDRVHRSRGGYTWI